ncbi:MAG: 23S rRNA (adenine(2503)-C(2))-methyltransferase RlmN [Defluviitaleaceae bacterium]|nr:23S rRNA (adenine(2503)-C(2))-methyltransferase RlmN [Defluviitaleaceae bacterium]
MEKENTKKTDMLSMLPQEIAEIVSPAYRAEQIFSWLHKHHATSFVAMNNLPLSLRDKLEEIHYISTMTTLEKHESVNDGTIKFLSATHDNNLVESVLMSYKHGNSVCISTQAGCRMGCTFCASAENGLARNLTAGEYCAQVYSAFPIKNIVLMGCGEPLDNYENTVKFIKLITHPKGINIGQRHITLSTCGLVPEIYKLADEKFQITLAVSLHAPDDETRQTLMPIAKVYPLSDLIKACKYYTKTTHRRLTFEYAMAKDINTSSFHAQTLVKLLKGMMCHVNLIPINKARGEFLPTSRNETMRFAKILEENHIPTTIRRSLGNDVNASCGQLRSNFSYMSY